MGVYEVAKLTEFDCWGCCSKIKCEIGSMNCVAVEMAKIACNMIMDGWNYEVSLDYNKSFEQVDDAVNGRICK